MSENLDPVRMAGILGPAPVRFRLGPADAPAEVTATMWWSPLHGHWRSEELFLTRIGNPERRWTGNGEGFARALRLPSAGPVPRPPQGLSASVATPGGGTRLVLLTRIPQIDADAVYWMTDPLGAGPRALADPRVTGTINDVVLDAAARHRLALATLDRAAPAGTASAAACPGCEAEERGGDLDGSAWIGRRERLCADHAVILDCSICGAPLAPGMPLVVLDMGWELRHAACPPSALGARAA